MGIEQFERTVLLVGAEGLTQLRAAKVAVVGCGAVGSFAVEGLARAGIGHLILVDGDVVAESNINRQLCALHSTIGQPKIDILKNRVHDICPDTEVVAKNIFIDDKNCGDILGKDIDFIIDAIDVVSGKIPLILYAQEKKIPVISSMGAAMKTDFSKIKVAPLNQTSVCPLAARVRRLVKEQGGNLSFPCVFSVERPTGKQEAGRKMGSLVTITGMFGLILANEVIKRIVNHV